MTFDRHGDIRITPQPIGLTGQDLLRFRGDIRSVKGEQYAIACARLQILLRSRNDVPRTDAAGTTGWRRRREGASGGGLLQAANSSSAPSRPIILACISIPPRPARTISLRCSPKQGRPSRIGSILRGGYLALIGAGQVDRVQVGRTAMSARIG